VCILFELNKKTLFVLPYKIEQKPYSKIIKQLIKMPFYVTVKTYFFLQTFS